MNAFDQYKAEAQRKWGNTDKHAPGTAALSAKRSQPIAASLNDSHSAKGRMI